MSMPELEPQVVEEDVAELERYLDAQRLADAEPAAVVDAPTSPTATPIDRPNQGQPPAAPPPVDLTTLPEFRKYQAENDRRLEQERQARLKVERELKDWQTRQEQAQIADLMEQAAEAVDPTEQRRHIDELTALRAQQYTRQMQEWQDYKTAELKARGLDPADHRFARQYAPGEVGLYQFRADMAAAETERLKADLSKAKQAADPVNIQQLVRQELAKARQASGENFVDVGTPQGTTDDEVQWQRDLDAVQQGRMSHAAFLKKHPA